ncbi:hypothetical protein FACS189490_07620 [Clostridia bacterium]|nr:hypothetical protein FACS189490_07620 [Clostridia bacterium]
MKPEGVSRSKGEYNFAGADVIVDGALSLGLAVHAHVMVWHQQTPAWLNTNVTPEKAEENMITHIKTVGEHFAGKVISWDVVNEAIADGAKNTDDWHDSLRQSPWLSTVGRDYIDKAFLAARAADPAAMLYYNDYNLDNAAKADAVYTMVKDINERYPNVGGRPLVDGIGMQGHYNINTRPADVERSIEKFVSLGVEVSITELDVNAMTALTPETEAKQAALYAKLFNVFLKYADNIARVTFWGIDDASSWRAQGSPLIFNGDLSPKEAFFAVASPDAYDVTIETVKKKFTAIKINESERSTPIIDGEEDVSYDGDTAFETSVAQAAWETARATVKTLYDQKGLYVFADVTDLYIDKTSKNAYEQDSVEVFVDESTEDGVAYTTLDGQYRVNYDNEASFDHGNENGFVSAAKLTDKGYSVEMFIPWKSQNVPKSIGFDVTVNDAYAGMRIGVMAANDATGTGYSDLSVLGTLELK